MEDAREKQTITAAGLGLSRTILLVAFTASLLLVKLGTSRTFTFHESLVAESAQEMLDSGDWLIPRIAGEVWLEKPPLAYWSVALFGELAGEVNEFCARLPSVFCGLAGVLLVGGLAARHYGRDLGLIAGLVQATMLYFITYARLAEVDIYLWLLVLGGLVIFEARFVDAPASPRWYNSSLVFLTLLGITQLAKGPMFGAVLLLAPCILFLLPRAGFAHWRWFFSLPGLLVLIALAVSWPAWVLLRYPEAGALWYEHTFGRVTTNFMNPKPPWYYLTTLPWQVLPWTFALLPALPGSLRTAWRQPRSLDRFLWLWVLVQTIILSIPRGKHHHYLIHALPPCSIWAARGLIQWRAYVSNWWNHPAWRWGGLGFASIVLGAAVIVLAGRIGQSVQIELAIAAGLLLASIAVMAWSCTRDNVRLASTVLFASCWALYTYAHAIWLTRTDNYHEETVLLQRLVGMDARNAGVATYRMEPARTLLYTHAPVTQCWSLDQLRDCMKQGQTAYVVTYTSMENELRAAGAFVLVDQTAPPGSNRWRIRPQVAIYQVSSPAPVHVHESSSAH